MTRSYMRKIYFLSLVHKASVAVTMIIEKVVVNVPPQVFDALLNVMRPSKSGEHI